MIEDQPHAGVLLMASGKVTGNTARPARIVFKGEPVPQSHDVVGMLHAFADGVDLRDRTGRRHQVIVSRTTPESTCRAWSTIT